ncbi:hypothetical protein ABLN87_21855 [Ruegeria sp. SCPT10]|uniref:hypothetical protein n=1 Tax=Ruegeria sp. SCP10 TaxID=3141377 RepID=UPI00333C40A9
MMETTNSLRHTSTTGRNQSRESNISCESQTSFHSATSEFYFDPVEDCLSWSARNSNQAPLQVNQSRYQIINEQLTTLGLACKLSGDRIVSSKPLNIDDAESQPCVGRETLTQIYRSVLECEDPHQRNLLSVELLPIVRNELDALIEESGDGQRSIGEIILGTARTYGAIFGGKDWAIDDIIGAINIEKFDDISSDSGSGAKLRNANIASACLVTTFMVIPTLIKDGPSFLEAIQNKDWNEATGILVGTLGMIAMGLSPVFAAEQRDNHAAFAAATGNALIIAEHIPEVFSAARELVTALYQSPNPESQPFTEFARKCKIKASATELLIGAVHGLISQGGMMVFNLRNIITGSETKSPLPFVFLTGLVSTAIADAVLGDQPFSGFEANRQHLSKALSEPSNNSTIATQKGKMILQLKINEKFNPTGFQSIVRALDEPSGWAVPLSSFRISKYSTEQEANFSMELLKSLFPEHSEESCQLYLKNIFDFEEHGYLGPDQDLKSVLDLMQSSRFKDRNLVFSGKGIASNNFFKDVIAHVVKSVVLEEQNQAELCDASELTDIVVLV